MAARLDAVLDDKDPRTGSSGFQAAEDENRLQDTQGLGASRPSEEGRLAGLLARNSKPGSLYSPEQFGERQDKQQLDSSPAQMATGGGVDGQPTSQIDPQTKISIYRR